MNESRHMCGWVMAHINESCHIWMSHGTHRNESCHIWMNHVTCVWLWLSVSANSNSNRQHIWDMTHSYMTLQQTAIDYNELQPNTMQHTATHCNTLHTATHCNTLQHTATHWNTLKHTATAIDPYLTRLIHIWHDPSMYAQSWIIHKCDITHPLRVQVEGNIDCKHCDTLQHTATHCNTL